MLDIVNVIENVGIKRSIRQRYELIIEIKQLTEPSSILLSEMASQLNILFDPVSWELYQTIRKKEIADTLKSSLKILLKKEMLQPFLHQKIRDLHSNFFVQILGIPKKNWKHSYASRPIYSSRKSGRCC